MRRTPYPGSGGREARSLLPLLLSPSSTTPFFPRLGLLPNPYWHHPHLQHPWVRPQTLLPGQIWGVLHLLMPKHKVLRDWMMRWTHNPHFSQKSHLPVTPGAKFGWFLFPNKPVTLLKAGSWDAIWLQWPCLDKDFQVLH